MARMTAAKAALSIRHDALADADTKSAEEAPLIGIEARIKLESRLRRLEQSIGIQSTRKFANPQQQLSALRMPNSGSYNPAADDVMIPAANVTKEEADEKKKRKQKTKALIEEITPVAGGSGEQQNGDDSMAIDEDAEAVSFLG